MIKTLILVVEDDRPIRNLDVYKRQDVPYIVARGRKGGSNVAACICNALLYMIDNNRGY